MRPIKSYIPVAVLAAALAPAAAHAMPWSWDMFDQPSHKAQEEPALPKAAGAVPVDAEDNAKDRAEAVKYKNPFPADAASLERGKAKYTIYCATCHGDGGKGDGPVGQKYVTPTDLTGDYVQGKPDGDIYYSIKYGGLAIMPSYAESMPPADRWHIVNYIKHGLGGKAPKAESAKGNK